MTTREGMQLAIAAARVAVIHNMRPFGTVIVDSDGTVLSEGLGSETDTDPTRHSEVLAIKKACRVKNGLLHGCTMYQTLEPCIMCCGAINHAKISRVVYGSCRSDLPALFRTRTITADILLRDTSTPACVISPDMIDPALRAECVALFDRESLGKAQGAFGTILMNEIRAARESGQQL